MGSDPATPFIRLIEVYDTDKRWIIQSESPNTYHIKNMTESESYLVYVEFMKYDFISGIVVTMEYDNKVMELAEKGWCKSLKRIS